MLFDMNHQLCKEYPALSPYKVDIKSYHDVVALYIDMRKLQIRYDKEREEQEKKPHRIMRPAGDTWF